MHVLQGSIGKSLARMTAADIAAVVEITAPLLDKLGYKVRKNSFTTSSTHIPLS